MAGTAPATESEQGEVSGAAPLTPIQRWFFEQELAVPAHYNQSLLLQTRRQLQADALKAAVRGLLSQHDALRLRFERGVDGWRQWHAPLSEELVAQSCTVIELSSVADEELGAAITASGGRGAAESGLAAWTTAASGVDGDGRRAQWEIVVGGASPGGGWRVLASAVGRSGARV